MERVIPDSIADKPHVAALDRLAGERFEGLDLSVPLIYLINTVPASALPYLGEQFDVMGYKGWKYADTEQKKRDLIKKSIELHRFKGTPWSVKESLKVIGVLYSLIEEGVVLQYNNQVLYNSTETYGGNNWARFRVLLPGNTFPIMTAALVLEMRELIMEYKNARSRLVDIAAYYNEEDTINLSEALTLNIIENMMDTVGAPSYDAQYSYNATINYAAYDDELDYQII